MGDALSGELTGIFLTRAGGDPMMSVPEAVAVLGKGLAGDRYAARQGHWTGRGDCEVTLMDEETLTQLASAGFDLRDGSHRRNLVVRGLHLARLTDRTIRIGSAAFELGQPRPPCRHLEQLTGLPGLREAMAHGRAGLSARVRTPGALRVGDTARVEDA